MPAGICLPPNIVNAFKDAITAGKIDPERLANMSSEERHELFSGIVGEGNAKFVNAQLESKLLLKNQQAGMLTWAKKLSGVTPEVKRDLMTRISKLDTVLNPTDERSFLKDLASTKLGVDVSADEAKTIAGMSSNLQELAAKQKTDGTFDNPEDRQAYGLARVDFGNHIASLKNAALKPTLKESLLHPMQLGSKISGITKSLRATLDDSALLRQGWKTMMTNPIIWQKNARASFLDAARSLSGKDVMRETMANIVSRPNYDRYTKMGLAIGNVEEEFPSALPEKVPLLGKGYKASETAYTGFLYKQRADIADKLLSTAKNAGVDINDKEQLKAMGKMINALTGRGDLGRFEGSAANSINNVFFSARMIKGNLDTLTAHQFQKNVTPFIRKQAAINLMKIVGGTATVMAIANAVKPGSAELNPISKNFGKIKVGNATFDISGGMSGVATLAAQIVKGETKSTTTGVITKLNSGAFGSETRLDVINDFFENKLSPVASVGKDLLQGTNATGGKLSVGGEAKNSLLPFPVTQYQEFHSTPNSGNALLDTIADGLGLSGNASQASNKDFSMDETETNQQFQAKVGTANFTKANKQYNDAVSSWLKTHGKQLDSLSQSDQQGTLTSVKEKIQNNIYKQYNFKATKAVEGSQKKRLVDSVK